MFAQIFRCPIHGEVWEVFSIEQIDTDSDEVWTEWICKSCNNVCELIVGRLHALSEDEMECEFLLGDNHEFDPEYYD